MDPRPIAVVLRSSSGFWWCYETDDEEGVVGYFSTQALAADHAELSGYRVVYAP